MIKPNITVSWDTFHEKTDWVVCSPKGKTWSVVTLLTCAVDDWDVKVFCVDSVVDKTWGVLTSWGCIADVSDVKVFRVANVDNLVVRNLVVDNVGHLVVDNVDRLVCRLVFVVVVVADNVGRLVVTNVDNLVDNFVVIVWLDVVCNVDIFVCCPVDVR